LSFPGGDGHPVRARLQRPGLFSLRTSGFYNYSCVKNPNNHFYSDRKAVISVVLIGVLSCFFSLYLFIIFLFILFISIILIGLYQERIYRRLRLLFVNGVIVVVSVFIICLCIESYLRLVQPEFLNLEVNILGDFTDFTQRGYLDEAIFKKPHEAFTILGLGDSFARNMAFKKKNYHNFLEAELLEKGEKRVHIINAGMEGIGPGYYWHFLKKYGDAIQPNLVIVGVFVGNDLEELDFRYVTLGRIGIKDYLDPGEKILRFCRFSDWWLYQVIRKNLILRQEAKSRDYEVKNHLVKQDATFSDTSFYDIQRSRMWIFQKQNQGRLSKIFNQSSEVFLNLKAWCQARNVGLLIAIFPDQFQVDDELRNNIVERYGLAPAALDISFPDQLLVQFCKKHDMHCLDMLADFQKHSRAAKLYRLNDTHWNDAGNRLAAGLIFQYLRQHRLTSAN
jgi:hypothetical protein